MTLYQKITSQEIKRQTLGLAFQSSNSKFIWFYYHGSFIHDALSSPPQWYITQRPPAVATIYANHPAEITAEIWSPGNRVPHLNEDLSIIFIKSSEPNYIFGPNMNIIYALNTDRPMLLMLRE